MRFGVRWRMALQFLTIMPVTLPSDAVEPGDWEASAVYYPLVGLMIGALLWGISLVLPVWPSILRALVLVTLYTLGTGGLHADGLMDTFDALGSRRPAPEALAVMKDSRVGAMGSLAGTLLLLLKTGALTLMPRMGPAAFILVPAVSRLAMLWAMAGTPAARRPNAPGLGDRMAGTVSWVSVIGWALGLSGGAWLAGAGWHGPVIVAAGLLTALIVSRYLTWRLTGMTGDTYGALNEIVEVVGWILAGTL
jgi:adenosylcobinamide-GDP ribazoletransferase